MPLPMPEPATLTAVTDHQDPTERARAAVLYLARLDRYRADALTVRDDALRASPAPAPALAEASGVSVATVKLARRKTPSTGVSS